MSWYNDHLAVKTTSGEVFTGRDTVQLAQLVYRRFGGDLYSATLAWQRLLENNTTPEQFEKLLQEEETK
jgi:hypothetical protein